MKKDRIKKSIYWRIFFFFTKTRRRRIKKIFKRTTPIAILLLLIDAFIYEPYFALHSEYVEISSKTWTQELSKLKIVVVSDFHIGVNSFEKWRFKKILGEINKHNPDIVLLLGDYVNRQKYIDSMDVAEIADGLASIKSKYGIFAISGNHDEFWALDDIRQNFKRVGIIFLENENIKVHSDYGDFYVAGIRDISEGEYDIIKTFKGIPKDAPCLFLSHEPMFPFLMPEASVSFFGHTHGGQIRLPIVGAIFHPKVVPFMADNMGLQVNSRELPAFTTRGVGTSWFNMRFYCTPVVEVVKIYPQKSE